MSIREGLWTYLSTHPGITSVVSDRIYLVRFPQEVVFPAITYAKISGIPYMQLHQRGDLDRSRYQFDCWGEDELQAINVAAALRDALEGFKGTMGSEIVHAVIPIEVGTDDFDEVTAAGFRVISEYEIWHVV